MKFLLKIFILLCFCNSSFGQMNCGFNYAVERLYERVPGAKSKYEELLKNQNNKTNLAISNSFTIPVVVHILHQGGSDNISDAQVNDAMAILCRDFRKKNADTINIVTQFQGIASDCSIQFSLATKDENGNCTTGITRHYDSNTNWTINQYSYKYTWNPAQYLNIYVVASMPSGMAGYAYYPGSVSPLMDGIVILNSYFGSIGTASPFGSRALTHEVGHFLNLQHVWGNTNNPGVSCGDDAVGDTPITKGFTSCDLTNAIDCTPGVTENVQNYMEYAFCSNMFTLGQKDRMHNCLNSAVANRDNLSSNANLIATGVVNPVFNCAPKAEFVPNTFVTCVGNPISFTDYSYNGAVTNWTWTSPTAVNTSTLQNGSLTFSTVGLASVKLTVGNSFGTDTLTKQEVTVLAGANSGITNVVESFENIAFPNALWIASTPQFGSPFLQNNATGATGSKSLWVNNYFDNPSEGVNAFSPAFNLQNTSSAFLNFTYAYAQKTSANNDQLTVEVSTDCGLTWTNIYSKIGAQLNTTGGFKTQAYLNPLNSHWKIENLNLQNFSGNSKVYFKFTFMPDVSGAGNNIFIDDINVSGITGNKTENLTLQHISVFPNPFNEMLTLKLSVNSNFSSLKLFDVLSREIKIEVTQLEADKFSIRPYENLKAGIYFLHISTPEGMRTLKLIKN